MLFVPTAHVVRRKGNVFRLSHRPPKGARMFLIILQCTRTDRQRGWSPHQCPPRDPPPRLEQQGRGGRGVEGGLWAVYLGILLGGGCIVISNCWSLFVYVFVLIAVLTHVVQVTKTSVSHLSMKTRMLFSIVSCLKSLSHILFHVKFREVAKDTTFSDTTFNDTMFLTPHTELRN